MTTTKKTAKKKTAPAEVQTKNVIAKKISTGKLMGNAMSAIVGGICSGYSTETGSLGDYLRFRGQFGIRVLHPEETNDAGDVVTPALEITTTAGILYVPEVIGNLLAGAVAEQLAESETGKSNVEFSFVLSKREVPKEESPVGYIWEASPIKAPTVDSSPVLRLLSGDDS